MNATSSISKGCFVFKKKKTAKTGNKDAPRKQKLLHKTFNSQPWNHTSRNVWNLLNAKIENWLTASSSKLLEDLVNLVKGYQFQDVLCTKLRTTALLTGVNQSDHYKLFETISKEIRKQTNALVAIAQSKDCPNLKSTIETMVSGFMDNSNTNDFYTNGSDDEMDEGKHLRRSQYSMKLLQAWYEQKYPPNYKKGRPSLTIIVPDFEHFNSNFITDFIDLLCLNCGRLPFILVLGVTTDKTVFQSILPFSITSRLNMSITQTHSSTASINRILDEIILSPRSPILLSDKVFSALLDIFQCYDLSIDGFLRAFKYCIMEHYYERNAYTLCTTLNEQQLAIERMTEEDIETMRKLPSFRPYVETMTNCKEIISILTDDNYFIEQLPTILTAINKYFTMFYGLLRLLLCLVQDLPKHCMGKELKDIYSKCVASNIVDSKEFKEAWQLLSFMSKEELLPLLKRSLNVLMEYRNNFCMEENAIHIGCSATIKDISTKLSEFMERITKADLIAADADKSANPATSPKQKFESRQEFLNNLLQKSKQPKAISEYNRTVADTLDYLKELFAEHLLPFFQAPVLYELFVFGDDSAVRHHLMNSSRSAIHTALNAPQAYLQCSCCVLENSTQIKPTLPDFSIIYKLHLESGHLINLFDWLNAFKTIVLDENEDDDDEEANNNIDPKIQARFYRAVAELEFLGFIKTSKTKLDHVTRLTW